MSSVHRLRLARPLGLISRAGIQHPQSNIPYQYKHRSGVRSFHVAPEVLAITQATQDAVLSLHSATQIPWFLLIPLLAAGMNVVFRLPFDVYIRKLYQRRSKLLPILQAWSWRVSRDVHKEGVPPAQREKAAMERFRKTESRIYHNLGLQTWKTYIGIFGFPFWLLGIDSVRRLCGGPDGLLRLVTGSAEAAPGVPGATEATATTADTMTADTSHVSTVDPSTVTAVVEHARQLPDPSIALEGCLWFPDLTVADPYHILPFALSAVLVANVLPKTSAAMRLQFGLKPKDESAGPTAVPEWRLRLGRALILLSAAVGPITINLPAAVHLYWLSSAATRWITSQALSYLIQNEKAISRCIGTEANIIRPQQSERPKPQSEVQKKEE
ncbi:hypothetical protein F4818DRAFT_313031 [Hypoxylon cercidicola]|nr:hypothetical protein F4818DRAFT_313031 [Hypoxylon cercidicola]